jgi:hypothetical protein
MNRAELEHIIRAASGITGPGMVTTETLASHVEALPLAPDRLDVARSRFRRLSGY